LCNSHDEQQARRSRPLLLARRQQCRRLDPTGCALLSWINCGPGGGRVLHEQGNPDHRLRVEHNRNTLLVHLSDEDGKGWLVLAVDRATRGWAVAQVLRQTDAAEAAYARLYSDA
jgi:hypothetical protein